MDDVDLIEKHHTCMFVSYQRMFTECNDHLSPSHCGEGERRIPCYGLTCPVEKEIFLVWADEALEILQGTGLGYFIQERDRLVQKKTFFEFEGVMETSYVKIMKAIEKARAYY
ncbi:hypothetical protein RUM43_004696 [Polyplax serrata]|uniref:Uncharacterized protein n=1 Tax=Polyplax serrata TaxID=468196 RepID=A0AAN8XLJ8_POLSC